MITQTNDHDKREEKQVELTAISVKSLLTQQGQHAVRAMNGKQATFSLQVTVENSSWSEPEDKSTNFAGNRSVDLYVS